MRVHAGKLTMLEKLPDFLGHVLRDQRAGLEKIAFSQLKLHTTDIELVSEAFGDYAPIPRRFTADGEGLSPPLSWTDVPAEAASLVLVVEDADAPTPRPLVHAIAIDLPVGGSLEEGALPSADHAGSGVKMGRNTYLQARWIPPDPPPGHGSHRYAFQVFAVSAAARFSDTPGREELELQIRKFALARGCLVGIYERKTRAG